MRSLITLLILSLAAPMLLAQQRNVETMLRAADSACAAVTSATYHAHIEYIGLDGATTALNETIFVRRAPSDKVVGLNLRVEVDGKYVYTFAYDGATMLLLFPKSSMLRQYDSTYTAFSFIREELAGEAVANLFSREEPLSKDVSFFHYDGDTAILGTPCSSALALLPDVNGMTTRVERWSFGREDHIPRRHEFSAMLNGSPFSTTLTISDLRLNVPLPDSLLTLPLPAGYVRDTLHHPVRQQPMSLGSEAPGWALKDAHGKSLSLADLRGRVVLLDFWYLACPPCQKAMPTLESIQRRYDTTRLMVVGINVSDSVGLVARFIKAKGFDYRLLFDGADVATAYHVGGYPTLYLIGRDGRILWRQLGYSEEVDKELEEQIQAALR